MTPELAFLGHLLVAAIMLHYGLRGRRGRLTPRGPGIRTPETLASPAAFEAANRAASPWMIASSAPWFVTATLLVASGGVLYRPLTIGAAVVMIVLAGIGFNVGAKAARHHAEDPDAQ